MSMPERRLHYRLMFFVLAGGAFSYSLLQSLVSPILPLLETKLHTSQNTITWVLTAYLLSASVATPILGRVGDMFGKKRMLVVVIGMLALGSILAGFATSISVMIIARVIQGFGGGGLPLVFGIIRDVFPREKVAGAVGTIAALLGVGAGVGLVLAGPIVNALDYHWLFWIPGIVAGAITVATHYLVPESPERTRGKISWSAGILLSAWLVALLIAVSQAPDWGWLSPKAVALLVVALVLGVAWVAVEFRSPQPLIDMRMMRLPAIWTTNVVTLLFGAGIYSMFAFVPEFVQTPSRAGYGFGASITESGLIVLPLSATMFLTGTVSGRALARFGAKAIVIAGSLCCVPAFLILAFAHSATWEVAAAMGLTGAGMGLSYSAVSNIVVYAVPSSQTGVASGMSANIRTIGGAIGAAVMGSIVTSTLRSNGLPTEAGYTVGFATLAGAAVLATVAALLIPKLDGTPDTHQREQAAMNHPELAVLAGATLVGDESE